MNASQLQRRIRRFYQSRSAKLFFKRPLKIQPMTPIISFSFDDFPRSALVTGGAILKECGFAATYYVALGLAGKVDSTGQMFHLSDIDQVFAGGHELGCHTFGHRHSGDTDPATYEQSVIENQRKLSELRPGAVFRSFSYPVSAPSPLNKFKVARYFESCRGGGQTFNIGVADLNYLSAYFLEKSSDNLQAVKTIIDENARCRGWLIFATHDVDESPTPFGCTPEFLQQVVQYAKRSGSLVLPVSGALDVLRKLNR